MKEISRRRFLTTGSLGVAVAGALAVVPGLGAAFKQHPAAMPMDATSGAEPLIAHVRSASTGEMSLLVGTDEVTHSDPDLAARLYAAARRRR